MKLSADGRLRVAARLVFVIGVGSIGSALADGEAATAGLPIEVAQLASDSEAPAEQTSGAPATEDKTTKLKGVQVTGTRIRQANLDSSVPVQTISAKQIELSGQNNAANLLRSLPVSGISTFTPANSNFDISGAGLNTVDLRNLGEDRTLVLVNGRRFVAGLPGSQVVDLNSIPVDFIERIETITGGASAIYGSDALAGAVNFVLRKDFQGVVATVQTGQTLADSDDIQRSYRVTAGSSFANGKGNALFNVSFNQSLGVFARDRKSTATDCTNLAFFSGDPADFRDCFTPTFSSFPPNTRIVSPSANPANDESGFSENGTTSNVVVDPVTGAVRPYVGATDGFNRNAIRALSTPLDRTLLASVVNYEINPSATLFFEGTYARSKARSELEPFPLSSEDVFDGLPTCFDRDRNGRLDECDMSTGIPLSSGVIPQALRDAVLTANPDLTADTAVVGFARRLSEVGNRGLTAVRQTFRSVTGIEGDLMPIVGGNFFKTLNYEGSLNYGVTNTTTNSGGQLNVANLREAFNVVTDPETNEVTCANPVAVAEGCAPVYILGQNTIGERAFEYIRAPSLRIAEIQQIVGNAFLSGSFGQIPTGGPIGFSAGIERRTEKSTDVPDALTQTGQNGGNLVKQQIGSFDVKEAFGELRLPLLVDKPFAKEFVIKGAIRGSDYSSIGKTLAYSLAADWQINDWARPRMQYARAVRAPNVGELFSAGSETFETVLDPCAGVTVDPASGNPAFFNTTYDATSQDAVLNSGINPTTVNSLLAQNCLADPIVAQRVSDAGGFAQTQAERDGTGGFTGASPAFGILREETSNSRSYGLVVTPKFGNKLTDNLTFSADFYSIDIKQGLGIVPRDNSLTQCYSSTSLSFSAENPFCTNVRRFQDGPQIGALDEVNGGTLNFGSERTSGVDVQTQYRLRVVDLIRAPGFDLGRLEVTSRYTHLLKQEFTVFGDTTNNRGKVGYAKDRAFVNLSYLHGPVTLYWQTSIIGKSDVDLFEVDDRLGKLPTVSFHDVQIRYNLQQDWLDLTVFAGINNVFDKFVEVGGTNGDLGQPVGSRTFPAEGYEPFGRAWYAGAQINL